MSHRGDLIEIPHSEETATLELLARRGVQQIHFEALRSGNNKDYLDRVIKAILDGPDPRLTGMQWLLQKRLGYECFFGPEEWGHVFGVHLSIEQVHKLPTVAYDNYLEFLEERCPFTNGKAVRDTHLAFLGLEQDIDGQPLTISRIAQVYSQRYPKSKMVVDVSRFHEVYRQSTEVCERGWYFVPISDLPRVTDRRELEDFGSSVFSSDYRIARPVEEFLRQIVFFRCFGRKMSGFGEFTVCQTKEGELCYIGIFPPDSPGLFEEEEPHDPEKVYLLISRDREMPKEGFPVSVVRC